MTTASSIPKVSIHIAGEDSLIIYFAEQVSSEISVQVQQAEHLIRQHMQQDIIDLVPSYASLMVMFNIRTTDHHQVRHHLRQLLASMEVNVYEQSPLSGSIVVELPVYYSAESGPELTLIAQHANLTVAQVIDIHQAQQYRVYAIGFAPGFAYLGEVDERIATPRLSTPRMKVPKGAVAIADRQTAVYPSVSPGGWNIIGLCPIPMFDATTTPTMPVKVGDKVKFRAITKDEYLALGGKLQSVNWKV